MDNELHALDNEISSDPSVAEHLQNILTEIQIKYNDLLLCVENKYPNETRHETAKRILMTKDKEHPPEVNR